MLIIKLSVHDNFFKHFICVKQYVGRDVYVGDIDEEINKYEQLSNLQSMNLMLGSGFNTQLWHDLQATNQHLGQLRMKKNVILLRLPRGV